ncbi:MAG: hypothetical protein VX475_16655 [Myxococcota bacterium]|nr:hypothetical protein [Myxococcota bacterium]
MDPNTTRPPLITTLKAQLFTQIKRPIVWLALLAMLAMLYSWMSPEITAPNERTRLYLTMAMLENGGIGIDDQVARYGKVFDLASREGTFYSDKAPGSSVIALPFVAVYLWLGGSSSIEFLTNFARHWVMIPFALLTLLLVRAISMRLGVERTIANQAAIALTVGTCFLHYGAAFFGHALVTCVALVAALAMYHCTHDPQRGFEETSSSREDAVDDPPGKVHPAWRFLLGFAGGLAFAIEYQAAVLCIAIAIAYMSTRRNWNIKAILLPFVGAMIPILATFAYNHAAFGGPFETSYGHLHHSFSKTLHSKGLFGIAGPTSASVHGLFFGLSRGMLLGAPIVMLGFFGVRMLWEKSRGLALYVGLGCAAYLLLITGTLIWHGGWGFGPRLLVPMFGLATIPGALALSRGSQNLQTSLLLRVYLVAGILFNALVITAFPEIPPEVTSPLQSIALPMHAQGTPSPNLGMTLLGLKGSVSLAPLAMILAVLCGYMFANHTWKELRSVRAVGVASMLALSIGLVVMEYPEAHSQKATSRFVTGMGKKRILPKEDRQSRAAREQKP